MKLLRHKDSADFDLLARYVVGECSPREVEQVRSVIAADEEKARILDELQQIWGRAKRPNLPMGKAEVWASLNQRIREDARIRPLPTADRPSVVSIGQGQRSSRLLFARAALMALVAAISIAAGAVLLYPHQDEPGFTEAQLDQEIVTRNGQRATIRLPDGSLVDLNAGSRLIAPKRFASDKREVQLVGEAYFEIAADTARPFIVRTSQGSAEVLGTAFNVSAYPGEQQARVAVAEGSVSVHPIGASREEAVILYPRDLGVISENTALRVHRNVNLDEFIGWRTGQLVFRNAPFSDVAAKLERKYGIEVELKGSSRSANGLTATFRDESLSQIIKKIAATLNLQYTWSREKVSFYSHGEHY